MTISVTGCSTWIRQLTSMKWNRPSVVDQELERAGADVADRQRAAHRGLADRRRGRAGGQAGRGRLLDELLVPALHRAVPLPRCTPLP